MGTYTCHKILRTAMLKRTTVKRGRGCHFRVLYVSPCLTFCGFPGCFVVVVVAVVVVVVVVGVVVVVVVFFFVFFCFVNFLRDTI